MYVSTLGNEKLVSVPKYMPGRIFLQRTSGDPSGSASDGTEEWAAMGEAAAALLTWASLQYQVCTSLRPRLALTILLSLAASDCMLDNNGLLSDTFSVQQSRGDFTPGYSDGYHTSLRLQ